MTFQRQRGGKSHQYGKKDKTYKGGKKFFLHEGWKLRDYLGK